MDEQFGFTGGIDLDGDGLPDVFDIDGDGVMDAFDIDGDGLPDVFDVDGPEAADLLDFDDDHGMLDIDVDVDDLPEGYLGMEAVDLDGDGVADGVAISFDLDDDATDAGDVLLDVNGDGIIESDQVFDADDWSVLFADVDDNDLPDVDEQILGWDHPGPGDSHAIFAQCMAYESLTGKAVDVDEVVQAAEEGGWYDPETGITADGMGATLSFLGAETVAGEGASLADVRECLDNGGHMVVSVDAGRIWNGAGDGPFVPNSPNHLVEVTGLDESDEEPLVIVSDPGAWGDAGTTVPVGRFMDAWEGSGFAYVEAYPPNSPR